MEQPPDTVLPCGCVLRCAIVNGVRTTTVIACRQTCRYYVDIMSMAAEKGVPVTNQTAP